jgi:hypothetical protein
MTSNREHQQALVGLARHNGRTRFSSQNQSFARIDPQTGRCLRVAVAAQANRDQYRTDFQLEERFEVVRT